MLPHIVFSTKHREPWITADVAERLYPYMGGIVRAEKRGLYDIPVIVDHVTDENNDGATDIEDIALRNVNSPLRRAHQHSVLRDPLPSSFRRRDGGRSLS